MNFNMNTVWSRAMELLSGNLQLLVLISAIFVLLPTMAIYMLIPDFQNLVDPTADPEVVASKMGEILGPIFAVSAIVGLFQFAGYSAMIALVGGSRPTVGQALGIGIKTVPSLIGVAVIFFIAYLLVSLLITVPFALLGAAIGAPGIVAIAIAAILVFVIWLMARMSMAMPALVLGETLNPLNAVRQSIRLTQPKQWSIVLFWVLLFVTFTVISILVSGVGGVMAALMGTGMLANVVVGLTNGAVSMVTGNIICMVTAAMYTELTGPSGADVEETFG